MEFCLHGVGSVHVEISSVYSNCQHGQGMDDTVAYNVYGMVLNGMGTEVSCLEVVVGYSVILANWGFVIIK